METTYSAADIWTLIAVARETMEVLQMSARERWEDPHWGAEVRALGERIGYGAMMASASAAWAKDVKDKDGIEDVGFVAGPHMSTVKDLISKLTKALGPFGQKTQTRKE